MIQQKKLNNDYGDNYPNSKKMPGQNTLSTIQADFDPP